ncbi:hypothetical protein JXQ70_17700, partial [bacterium]|nr:hypothetical protein [bacterium]
DISGATNSTYTANFTDTHAYNCKVRGSGCSDDATDGAATSITWQYEPTFGGITSALDGGIGACTINLAWNAATSACPGPIRYSVYRDTVSPVDTIPANRIAENLSATSYSDTYNLVNGTTYYYVVHAIDLSNSAEDTNTVELSATATFTFGGITSAVSGGLDTCTIDLTWNAATSSCPGPFLYSVYRDTVTPVDTIPANRIVSGVSGTSYADDDTLVNGTTYYYVVHAVDQSSFNEDTNTVEASAAPYGPGGGTQTFLDEDFDTAGIPGTWTIVDGNSDSWTWYEDDSTDPAGCANTDPASPIGGIWATVDSDCNSVDMDEQLITPVINLSTTATVSLEFDHYFNRYGAEYADVDVRSTNTGGVWTNVAQWTADTANPLHSTIDITAQAAGASDVQIRWHYYDANYEWYWYVDNILVTGYVAVACTTGSGCTDPGQPIITGITDLNGCAQSGIQVAYTAGSGATSHDLYRDSNLVVTGYVSGATYNPGDTSSHNYIIRAIDGACYTDSTAVAGTDANNTPGAPVISSVTDLDACAATGVSIVFTAGSGATSHNLWVDGSQAVTGITSPYTYVPGNTSSHSYVVRAINGSCYANSNAVAGTDANNTPGAPVISSVTDLDACAATGVSIVFTAGSGATSHNLWVDGSQTVTGITSPYTYVPGNTSSHSYVVRAINGSCYANSNAMAGTDVNNGVTTAPVISSVTDLDACAATGVSVVFTAGSPASSHNLWVDGSQAVTGITSPYTYVPGDTSSHSYVVRAINGSCYANSNAVAGTDVDDAVITTPVITDITDPDPYTYTGLIITYTAGSPSTSHDLWMDGALLVTGFNSGDTTPAEDGNSHSYFIRAWNNTCYADSLPEMYYPPIPPIPPEITPIDWTDKTTLSWPEETTSTLGYILYRGELANLADLLDTDTDFCTRWTGSSSSDTSATGLSETATGGDCYYYLVTGVNSNGEGSAGEATAGARIVNTTGACP